MIDLNVLKENPELAKSVKLEISGADLLAFGESIQKAAIKDNNKAPLMSEEYLTTKQIADILQVSKVTIWHWDKKGITNPLRVGNMKRYRRSDIEKVLQKQKI